MKPVTVPSDTRPGVSYTVKIREHADTGIFDLTCQCEGYKHRGTCKHTARVASQANEKCGCGGHMTYAANSVVGGGNTLSCDKCEFTVYC